MKIRQKMYLLKFYIHDEEYNFSAVYPFRVEKDAEEAFKKLMNQYDYYKAILVCKDEFSSKIY